MQDQRGIHLTDYIAVLRRRRKQVYYTAAAVFIVAALLAFLIPPVYRSTATILIEQQEVPQDIVASTVTGYANQRLQIIQKRVLTHDNLWQIAEKLDLYPEQRAKGAAKQIVSRIRSNIKLESVSANVTDPRSGASHVATIAFTLSFDAPSPEVAQKGADEVVELFLNENLRIRTQKAERTSGFLADEEEKLRQQIVELEAKLAAYKERYTGRLPELMTMNMSLMERTQKELEDLERQIYSLEERKLELQSQLAQVEPYTGKSPAGRLRELQTEYLSAAAIYAPNHPDVVRMRRELDELKRETGLVDEHEAVEAELKRARAELATARQTYAEGHPDVVKLKSTVAALERKLRSSVAGTQSGFVLKPDNPAYIAIQTQLSTIDLNLKAAKEQRARVQEKTAEYERRLIQTPRVEQEGLVLQREYDSAIKKYREIKQNLMSAELAVELEKEQKGERFSMLESPQLPEEPRIPNRRAFLLLGIVLGFGSGAGVASVAEYMDRTVRGSRAVAAVLGAPPLAVIPQIPAEDPYLKA